MTATAQVEIGAWQLLGPRSVKLVVVRRKRVRGILVSDLILQLGEAPSSVASDGSRPSDDEGGWPLEEMR
eukprot:SAG22_NODE_7287_length_754_cov_5.422901_1_plen_69_part_01